MARIGRHHLRLHLRGRFGSWKTKEGRPRATKMPVELWPRASESEIYASRRVRDKSLGRRRPEWHVNKCTGKPWITSDQGVAHPLYVALSTSQRYRHVECLHVYTRSENKFAYNWHGESRAANDSRREFLLLEKRFQGNDYGNKATRRF